MHGGLQVIWKRAGLQTQDKCQAWQRREVTDLLCRASTSTVYLLRALKLLLHSITMAAYWHPDILTDTLMASSHECKCKWGEWGESRRHPEQGTVHKRGNVKWKHIWGGTEGWLSTTKHQQTQLLKEDKLWTCSLKQRNHSFILPLHMLHSDQVWVLLSQMEEVVISWYLSHHTHTSTSVMHSRKRWWLGKGLNMVIFNLSSEHLVSRNEGQRAEQSHEKGIKDNLPAGWLLLNWQPQKFPFLQAQSRKTVFLVTQ